MLLLMLSKEVEKFLFSLPPKQFKQVTVSMLKLMSDPIPDDSGALKGRAAESAGSTSANTG